MENNLMSTEDLKQAWRDLFTEVRENEAVNQEAFHAAFSATYALLVKHLNEESLDKDCMGIVAQAYLFASIKNDALDESCLAAFVLTERMLTYCAFSKSPETSGATNIYLAEARRDVRLNFEDVEGSMTKLTKVFKEIYWYKQST